MSIEHLVKELDRELTETYAHYCDLHEQLDVHRGKLLADTNLVEVNRLLKEIQDTFALLYPAYHFVGTRYESAVNAINSYNHFIEQLKKAGAQQHEPEHTS